MSKSSCRSESNVPADIFIDALKGSNKNSGTSPTSAFKTFAKAASLFNYGDIAPSTGDTITIHILTDLPESDPVSFPTIVNLGPGVKLVITGRQGKKTILSGKLTGVIYKDRSTNTPDQVRAGMLPQKAIGLPIRIPGRESVAYGAMDRGGNFVQVSTWAFDGVDFDGFVFPGEPPQMNDSFEVVDYPKVTTGRLEVSMNVAPPAAALTSPPPATLTSFGLTYLYFRTPSSEDFEPMQLPTEAFLGSASHCYVSQCICDRNIQMSRSNLLGNNCNRTDLTAQAGSNLTWLLGLVVNSGGDYPGAMRIEKSTALFGGDPMFVGSIDPMTFEGTTADVQVFNSFLFSGPYSVWKSIHGVFPCMAGQVAINPFDLYGEVGFVPIWGTGNVGTLYMAVGQSNGFEIVEFAPDLIKPTIEYAFGPGGPVLNLDPTSTDGFAWDNASASFSPAPVPTTWANFDVFFPAGFKVFDDGVQIYSNATSPAEKTSFVFEVYDV